MRHDRHDTARKWIDDGRGASGSWPERGRTRPLVLLVEDDPNDREIYGKILWYNGFDVIEGEDGAQGVELARTHVPDVVVVDLIMPHLNGIEVCHKLKADPATARVPIIVLTGQERLKFGELARDAGCVQYLEKPIRPLKVLEAVESLVGRAPPAGETMDSPDA
jgi:two-component system, cell cycle response regulator DivK